MMKHLFSIPLAASLLVLGTGSALAQAPAAVAADSHSSHHPAATASTAPQADSSEGEITRWDPRTLRLTLPHGEIKNLEMQPMHRVYSVEYEGEKGDHNPGKNGRCRAEQVKSGYHGKRIEKAPGSGCTGSARALKQRSCRASHGHHNQRT